MEHLCLLRKVHVKPLTTLGKRRGHRISIEQWEHGILLDAFLWIRVRRAVALPVLTLVAAAALGDEVVQEDSVLHVLTVVQVVLVRFAGAVYRFVNLVTALIFLVILVVLIWYKLHLILFNPVQSFIEVELC